VVIDNVLLTLLALTALPEMLIPQVPLAPVPVFVTV